MKQSESLLRQLLQNLGFNLPIHSYVVFINSEFTLYQTPLNKPFIFPTQLNRFLTTLNAIPSKLNERHKILADKLLSKHIKESPFKILPIYDFEQLQKGITCIKCTSFSIHVEGQKCICRECGLEEGVAKAIMRSVKEFKLLFPQHTITTNVIHDWCKVINSKKRIRSVLEKNYKKIGVRQWRYYE